MSENNAAFQPQYNEGIPVKNAGIVLLNNYIPILFERLGLTAKNKFVDTTAQTTAVQYLQYVVTGFSRTEESLLPLNKLLCGLPISHPVPESINITNGQKELINGMLKAMIGHWPAIGDSSIDGFRGNWLVRDGLLTEDNEKWELTLSKRPYDILINKSPFSFSFVRLPWMDKTLHVNWPF